ncbi:hypothetical protein [Algicola sagamiensis]|uniref:hypothetical protein n=1 Tax=Algicola sagamiensis TaxID=163869 RepID=UPI0003628204|nr:hypothetical protein [Algicola sagamiensis]
MDVYNNFLAVQLFCCFFGILFTVYGFHYNPHSQVEPNESVGSLKTPTESNVVQIGTFSNELMRLAIQRAILNQKTEVDVVTKVLELNALDEKLLKQGKEIIAKENGS